jgi:hypothetical protein
VHTDKPLVPESSYFEVEIAILEVKGYKSPGVNQVSAEMIQAKSNALRSDIHRRFNFVWNWEELPQQWKEHMIMPSDEKGDKTDYINHREVSLFPTAYKILSNILLSKLTPDVHEVIGDL